MLCFLLALVAAAALVAQNVELGEVMEPVLAPILADSMIVAIPGFAQIAGIGGAVLRRWNSKPPLLTLGIGCLAGEYCGSVIKPSTLSLRRTATVQPLQCLIRRSARRGARQCGDVERRQAHERRNASILAGAGQEYARAVLRRRAANRRATGASFTTVFLVQLVAGGVAETSTAIAEVVVRKRR